MKKTRITNNRHLRESIVSSVKSTARQHHKAILNLITLPIKEIKQKKISFLCDTGATVTLVKFKNLKDKTLIHNRMALTGVTGHKMYTIGKIKVTIIL